MQDDIDFNQAMKDKGVTPQKAHDRVNSSTTKLDINTKKRQFNAMDDSVQNAATFVKPMTSDELLSFSVSGVQEKQFKELKSGRLGYEGRLDLHGYTCPDAMSTLSDFIQSSQKQNKRVLLVIHGKGDSNSGQEPILKAYVNQYLQTNNRVLAFCSAQNKDGGSGALYLLLRKLT